MGWNFWVEVPAPLAAPAPDVAGTGADHAPAAAAPPAPGFPPPLPQPVAEPYAPAPAPQPVPVPHPTDAHPSASTPSAPAPSVPYAEYQHGRPALSQPAQQWSGTPGIIGTPGMVEDQPRSGNPLLWVVPLTIVLIGLIIFGILALAGVFSSDVRDGSEAAVPTVAATPTAEAPPESEPAPGAPLAETPAAPAAEQVDDGAFCTDVMTLFTAFGAGISRETAAEFVAEYEPAVTAMAGLAVPAELAEAWEFKRTNDTAMLAELKAGDPLRKPMEAYIDYNVKAFTDAGAEYEAAETSINEYAQTNCF